MSPSHDNSHDHSPADPSTTDDRQTYVVAVKREYRNEAGHDWSEVLEAIPGLEVVPGPVRHRLQIEATPDAATEARRRLGDLCYVEPVRRRQPL